MSGSGGLAPAVAGILQQHGLTVGPKRRRRAAPRSEPLTLCDACSRYLLRCQLLSGASYGQVKPVLEAAFREYGLPRALRTDNGPPFATLAVGGGRGWRYGG